MQGGLDTPLADKIMTPFHKEDGLHVIEYDVFTPSLELHHLPSSTQGKRSSMIGSFPEARGISENSRKEDYSFIKPLVNLEKEL